MIFGGNVKNRCDNLKKEKILKIFFAGLLNQKFRVLFDTGSILTTYFIDGFDRFRIFLNESPLLMK